MSKFVLGIAMGTALGYVVCRMQQKGYFEGCCDDMHEFAYKAKKKVNNLVDMGENEMEYAKDRVEYKARQAKDKLDDMME